jgi:hypothetical protein
MPFITLALETMVEGASDDVAGNIYQALDMGDAQPRQETEHQAQQRGEVERL